MFRPLAPPGCDAWAWAYAWQVVRLTNERVEACSNAVGSEGQGFLVVEFLTTDDHQLEPAGYNVGICGYDGLIHWSSSTDFDCFVYFSHLTYLLYHKYLYAKKICRDNLLLKIWRR